MPFDKYVAATHREVGNMAGKRDDRRVEFTKKLLFDAMIELLAEKPIQKITVKELCERADINRGTFYAHFSDTYELLAQVEEASVKELVGYVRALCAAESDEALRRELIALFTHIYSTRRFWTALLGPNGHVNYYDSLFRATYEDFAARRRSGSGEVKLRLLYTQLMVGCVGMTMRWLNDEPEEPVETLAEVMFALIRASV